MAIIGMHALIYSTKADEVRRFFADILEWRSVDGGDGWLVFAAPPTELAVHPGDDDHHELWLMCDDIMGTVAALKRKGVGITRGISDRGWGLVTAFKLPSGAEFGLYEPRHPTALARPRSRKPARKRP